MVVDNDKSGGIFGYLMNSSSIKIALFAMVICAVMGVVPIDAIVKRFPFLQKLPCSSVMIKAVTTGIATFAVSSNVCKLS